MLEEYKYLLIFAIFSVVLSFILVLLSMLLGTSNPDSEKVSVYECGFNPYLDSRQKFEIRFILIGILFIIFDIEISFLFPWAVVLSNIQLLGYWTMMVFLAILTLGLVYEFLKGGLEWE